MGALTDIIDAIEKARFRSSGQTRSGQPDRRFKQNKGTGARAAQSMIDRVRGRVRTVGAGAKPKAGIHPGNDPANFKYLPGRAETGAYGRQFVNPRRSASGGNLAPKAGLKAPQRKKALTQEQINRLRPAWNPQTGENHPDITAMRRRLVSKRPTRYTQQGNPIPNGPNKMRERANLGRPGNAFHQMVMRKRTDYANRIKKPKMTTTAHSPGGTGKKR
jgi:hypothetical protein